MTPWTERILQAFPEDLSSFWIASDPDNLLLDENILRVLRDRGFEVLPFEDSIAFRVEYEERYRVAWDRGADGACKALVLQSQAKSRTRRAAPAARLRAPQGPDSLRPAAKTGMPQCQQGGQQRG